MHLILADTFVTVRLHVFQVDEITIDEKCISQSLLRCKLCSDLNDEERVKKNLVTEILKTGNDVGGPILIHLKPASQTKNYDHDYESWMNAEKVELHEVCLTPSFPERSIFKSLVHKFQEKIRISLHLKWYTRQMRVQVDFGSATGMKIDPETFKCEGHGYLCSRTPIGISRNSPVDLHVKLVADIDVDVTPSKQVHFARRILERGTCSDLIISAENGTKIKAHKAFLCVCSPVLEAMLGSGEEESESLIGEVDMSDLSEEGVRAFLRYVYYGDLQEPQKNFQVAYELFYAGHKYDVPELEAEMKRVLLDTKNEDVDVELALKIFMFTRNIETAVELKIKALGILRSFGSDSFGVPSLDSEIDKFVSDTSTENLDVALAFKIYLFARNIKSAIELKDKAIRVLSAKWEEFELLQEYNDFFENPANSKTIKELCKDLAKAARR